VNGAPLPLVWPPQSLAADAPPGSAAVVRAGFEGASATTSASRRVHWPAGPAPSVGAVLSTVIVVPAASAAGAPTRASASAMADATRASAMLRRGRDRGSMRREYRHEKTVAFWKGRLVPSLRGRGYVDEMTESEENDPRANQKARTRQAILDAALEFLDGGTMPTVVDAAERAKVSRATAYRYFPTQPSLVQALVDLNPTMREVTAAVDGLDSDDPAERLQTLLDAYNSRVVADEPWMRAILRTILDAWLKSGNGGPGQSFVRVPTRLRWIEEVLAPATDLDDDARRRAAAAIALTMGLEPIIVLKDVCGLDDEEALATLSWAADALLRAALDEAS
jgi:AcrR family transcriptional regulator